MVEFLFVFIVAVMLDTALGDPPCRCHPVRLMGTLAQWLEHLFRRGKWQGIGGGITFTIVCLAISVGFYLGIRMGMSRIHPLLGSAFDALILWLMYAHRDLIRHARDVYRPLAGGQMDTARQKVSMMVGRDTCRLDTSGIARATIESIAENFVDGSLGILFWVAALFSVSVLLPVNASILCVSGAVVYRCANTLDAMVGYRNPRYEKFGKFSARLDDALNYIPARVSLVPLAMAGALMGHSMANGANSWRLFRKRLASINSGHPESLIAGLLNVRLGGPAWYHGEETNHGWIWDAGQKAEAQDIRKSIYIINIANGLCVIAVLAILVGFTRPTLVSVAARIGSAW